MLCNGSSAGEEVRPCLLLHSCRAHVACADTDTALDFSTGRVEGA